MSTHVAPTQKVTKKKIKLIMHTPTLDDRPVYVAGNFNNWTAKDARFKMDRQTDGKYIFEFPEFVSALERIEYKYTRGGWDEVELDEYYNEISNRILEVSDGNIRDVAYNWKIDGYTYPKKYYPIIELVADNFDIPQMGKSRRVRAVLPYNYYQTDKQYPVIYMQDGQNLFDNAAPFGNWGMDKKMAVLTDMGAGDFIIVCVDHAESDRILEYNPYRKTSIGFGEGKKYVRFLADTLKPFIDKKYRTKTERQFTGVGGSSMGGLISIYAGLMLPKIFGRLLVFSPSLWVSANILSDSVRYTNIDDTRVYIYAGGNEGSSMIPNAQRFRTALEQQGIGEESIDIFFSIDPDGKHTESRWGAEFPKAIKWLFF